MSSVELTEAIAAELDENPALEMLEQSTCPICGSTIAGTHCTECLPGNAAGAAPEAPNGTVGEWSLRDESDDLDPIARAEAEFTLQEQLDWTLRDAVAGQASSGGRVLDRCPGRERLPDRVR